MSGNKADCLHLDQRHLRHGAAARRAAVVAVAARALRLLLDAGLARLARPLLRNLLRLWRDWPFEELEAELVVAGLVLVDDDADMAAAFELAEQHLVGEPL